MRSRGVAVILTATTIQRFNAVTEANPLNTRRVQRTKATKLISDVAMSRNTSISQKKVFDEVAPLLLS